MTGTRTRDAEATRQALLAAAQAQFGQKGFDATTIRDIGEQAGVDASLIARYFGSKADLYVATVAAEGAEGPSGGLPATYEHLGQMIEALVSRADSLGPGPITQALVRADTSAEIRQAAQAHLVRRMVEPLAANLGDQGVEHPRLRAEVAVSALIGVSLGRALGWFDDLPITPARELTTIIAQVVSPTRQEDADQS